MYFFPLFSFQFSASIMEYVRWMLSDKRIVTGDLTFNDHRLNFFKHLLISEGSVYELSVFEVSLSNPNFRLSEAPCYSFHWPNPCLRSSLKQRTNPNGELQFPELGAIDDIIQHETDLPGLRLNSQFLKTAIYMYFERHHICFWYHNGKLIVCINPTDILGRVRRIRTAYKEVSQSTQHMMITVSIEEYISNHKLSFLYNLKHIEGCHSSTCLKMFLNVDQRFS